MSKYEILNKIYKENEGIAFNLAVEWLMENGFEKFRNITDEDIDNTPSPNLLDDEFFKRILKVAREIAQTVNPTTLIQFEIVEKTFTLNGLYDKER